MHITRLSILARRMHRRALACRRRMDEVREMEKRATVEDLMYAAVLEKFLSLGVNMMGNMDNILEKVRETCSKLLSVYISTMYVACSDRSK